MAQHRSHRIVALVLMTRRLPRPLRSVRSGGMLASALAVVACSRADAPSAPSAPKTYTGVTGVYTVRGSFKEVIAQGAQLAGKVTLTQPDPTSPALTGTASVVLSFPTGQGPTYNHVASATRIGVDSVDFLLTSGEPYTGTWEFVGVVSDGQVSGTQSLDLFPVPGSGGFTAMGGTWSGTR